MLRERRFCSEFQAIAIDGKTDESREDVGKKGFAFHKHIFRGGVKK
jgi:hypothetical protein